MSDYHYTDEIPALHELIQWGGRPGCEYAYVDMNHLAEAQASGWRALAKHEELGGGTFIATLVWKGEERPFVVCERGTPLKSVAPQSYQCELYVSEYLTADPSKASTAPPKDTNQRLADVAQVG